MHGLAVKLRTMFRRTFATGGHRAVVALPIIQVVIYVAVEVIRAMVPRTRADEYAIGEPLRAIIAIRSTIVRGRLVITVRANRWLTNANRNLRGGIVGSSQEKASSKA
jgi:hypothetical protein